MRSTDLIPGVLLVGVILAAPLVVHAQQSAAADLTTTKIFENLYVLSGPQGVNTGNVAVFLTDEGAIVVDDKFDEHVAAILEAVAELTDQPVRYVLNTHHHLDHSGGNAGFQELAEIIAHRNARRNMVKQSGSFGSGRPESDLPRITFNKVTSVFLGGKEVSAHYFGRGHTDGDAVIYFPAERVIHTGDLYVPGGFLVDYSAGGSALEWAATLEAILALDFDTIIPGHLQLAVSRDELVQHIRDFGTVRERLQDLISRGVSREDVRDELELEDLHGWDVVPWVPESPFLRRSFEGLYDELLEAQLR